VPAAFPQRACPQQSVPSANCVSLCLRLLSAPFLLLSGPRRHRFRETKLNLVCISRYEAELAETISVIGELDFMLANLKKWMAPEHVETPLLQKPATSKLIKDPKGVVLVLGAWNFPVLLSVLPMATAISAGNTVVLKPSEVSPASAALIAQLIPKCVRWWSCDQHRVVQKRSCLECGGAGTWILVRRVWFWAVCRNPLHCWTCRLTTSSTPEALKLAVSS
jgi:hypothetical protein